MKPLTIPVPGGREAGSRVRFRPASGTGEPTHPDPAKAEGRATARGTGTDTDTNTGVWLTACRSPRRSFPPRSERWSWRGATGWRRKEYLCRKLRKAYLRVATSRLADPRPGDVEAPLRPALKLADRAEASRAEIDGMLGIPGPSDSIRGFIGHVGHRADLIERRILKGGTIPHRGKVHPISGPHTRWISKGKAGVPVKPGVPVRVPGTATDSPRTVIGSPLGHRIAPIT